MKDSYRGKTGNGKLKVWAREGYPKEWSGPVRTLMGEELERVKAELLAREAKRK